MKTIKMVKKFKTLFLLLGLFAFAFQTQATSSNSSSWWLVGTPTLVPSSTSYCPASSPGVNFVIENPTPSTYYKLKKNGIVIAAGTSDALGSTLPFYSLICTAGTYTTVPATTTVVITNSTPSAPTGEASQTFCSGIVANLSPTGTDIKWYAYSTGGSVLSTSTALENGNHYYASQTVEGCESVNRLDVLVTNHITPGAPGVTGQTFCSGIVGNLVATGATGATFSWYSSSTGGTALSTSTPLLTGTNSYYASQTVSNCESSRVEAFITNHITPDAPTGELHQTVCYPPPPDTRMIHDLVATGENIQWYANSTGGVALASTATIVDGEDYYATQTIDGCESTNRFEAIVNNILAPPTAPATQTFCMSAKVSDLVATGESIKWYSNSTGGVALASTVALINNHTYYATQTKTYCGESVTRCPSLVIINTTHPPVPTGASTQSFCPGSLVGDLVAIGTDLKWYHQSSGYILYDTTEVLLNNTHYWASQTVGTCESLTRFDVLVSLYPTPDAPEGAVSDTFCNSGTVADLLPTGENIKWYEYSTGGTPLADTTSLSDETSYYASQTSEHGCESVNRLEVGVIINAPHKPHVCSHDTVQTFCAGIVADLHPGNVVKEPTIHGIIKWYATSTGGSPLSTSTPLVDGNYYYASKTITEGTFTCESVERSKVLVHNTDLVVNNPEPICIPYTADLTDPAITAGSQLHDGTLTYWMDTTVTIELANPDMVGNSGKYFIMATFTGKGDVCERMIKPVVVSFNEHCPKTWTGTISSDWSNDGNWFPEGVPMSYNNVIIPLVHTHMPIVDLNPAECNDFTIESNAYLTINPGNALTVYGEANLLGPAEFTNLYVKTEGSYIDKIPAKASQIGKAQVEKTMAGNARAWYIGSPLSSAITAGSVYPGLSTVVGVGTLLKKWNEPVQAYSIVTPGMNIDSLPLTGYNVRHYGPEDINATFVGMLNTGDVTRTGLTNTGLGSSPGYNLVCNPYPSAINWGCNNGGAGGELAAVTTNLETTIWYRTSGVFATYNPAGNGGNGVGANGGVRYMQAMQSFWVTVYPSSVGTLKIKQAARIHSTLQFYKKSDQSESNIFRIEASRNDLKDEAVLTFNQGISSEFDKSDSKKMFSDDNDYPQVFTLTSDNVEVAINGLPELTTEVRTVPLGFTNNVVGTCTLKATNLDQFSSNVKVYLEDVQQNVIQDLRQSNTYSFNSGVMENADRFKLHFSLLPLGISDPSASSVTTYSYENNIYVNTPAANGTIELYNILGEKIMSQQSVKGLNKLQTNLTKGVYIVKVQNGANVVTEKVMINK